MASNHLHLPLVFMAGLALEGCALGPRYQIEVLEPHKDVLHVLVHVPARLVANDYRSIAETEIAGLLAARAAGEVPLYEIRFTFLAPATEHVVMQTVATYVWTADASAALSQGGKQPAVELY